MEAIFLADKNIKTVRKLALKTASGSSSDLTSGLPW